MKKISILMFLLMVSAVASAQKKMTIKTGKGQTVEITCDGISPKEIAVAPDGTVTFKLEKGTEVEAPIVERPVEEDVDSVDTFVETDSLTEVRQQQLADSLENSDVLVADSLYGSNSQQTTLGFIANTLAEELSPEYAAFEKEHEGTHPGTERELAKRVAKQFFNKDDVETVDAIATLFSDIRFTKDSTFVPTYEQRKPRPSLRTYDIIELSGSLGKNIEELSQGAEEVNSEDYGDDTENHKKYGGGIKYSRVYMPGTEIDGKWQPNKVGFAWSWGGLLSYSYEDGIGSYANLMGKVGVQIGHDICIGVDALVGGGITPFNTFLSDDVNYNLINKSAFCFKYGMQIWGSLNFSKDTYTAVYGRFIRSIKPSDGKFNLSGDWEMVYEDFDPNSWTVGLAVGYKFGAPAPLSQNKRLQASLSTGYYFTGSKSMMVSADIERLTQVSKSTTLSYGLNVENVFGNKAEGKNCASVMLSAGFQVCQPFNSWFWGAKLLGGVGEYQVVHFGENGGSRIEDFSKMLCGRAALQLSTGFKIGKCSSISCAIRAGYHLGDEIKFDNFDEGFTSNLNGFDLNASVGYNLIF